MSETAAIDALNRTMTFDASGRLTDLYKPAALEALADLKNRRIADEMRRCIDAGSFADNRLVCLSDHAKSSGLMVALMSTPYVKDVQDRFVTCFQAFEFEDTVQLAPVRQAFPAP